MTLFQAIVLAIVEGITEFLPISSTGHLVLTANLLSIDQTNFVKSFEIIIQLGAIMAVVFLYGKSYLKSIKVWRKIILAFLPTAVLGFLFYSLIKDYLIGNTSVTLWALFLGGFILLFIDKLPFEKNAKYDDITELTDKQAMAIGVFQSISMVPGVSRAAASIIGGLVIGLKRKAAVEFSFLLAIPTMVAATSLDLYESKFAFTPQEWTIILVGVMVSFFVAILAIKFFLKVIQTHSFAPFGIYRILLALLYFLIIT